MNQNEALNILIESVKKGYNKHIYTLEEAGAIFLAIQIFTPPVPEKKVDEKKENNNED